MKIRYLGLMVFLLLASGASFGQKESKVMPRSATDPVKAGDIAPDFSLMDDSGKSITLSKIKRPVVLVFYRGYW